MKGVVLLGVNERTSCFCRLFEVVVFGGGQLLGGGGLLFLCGGEGKLLLSSPEGTSYSGSRRFVNASEVLFCEC